MSFTQDGFKEMDKSKVNGMSFSKLYQVTPYKQSHKLHIRHFLNIFIHKFTCNFLHKATDNLCKKFSDILKFPALMVA